MSPFTHAFSQPLTPDGLKGNFAPVQSVFGTQAASASRFAWGDEVLPGITAVQTSDHTPGMTAFHIASEGESVMFVADVTNNPLLFVRNPEWQAMFDMNPEESVAARRRLLDQAAGERLRLFFFHAPSPGWVCQQERRPLQIPAGTLDVLIARRPG